MMKKKIPMTSRPTISIACAFKNLIFTSLFFSLSAQAFEYQEYEKKIKNGYSLRSVVDKLPKNDLEQSLRDFVASGRPSRVMGSPGHARAQVYLEKKLQSFNNKGATFSKQSFTTTDKKDGVNFIWEKKGATASSDVIILGANYDTLLKDQKTHQPVLKGEMPGADNNGSGVAILLSMIDIINKLEVPKTIKVVFYDCEEFGGAGSKEFAQKMKTEMGTQKIVGVINLSMLAHDSKIGDKEHKMGNMNIYLQPRDLPGHEASGIFGQMIVESGKRNYSSVEFLPKETFSGDFFPSTSEHFWAQGIPAVTMTQNRDGDLNPRYMSSNDFVETLNLNTYTNVFKYVTSSVLAWDYDIVK
ncbi:MAG: M28 family peptidase [Bacteriovorax sp.]|nr:M28 family peptidase [Bacteriovorax sp.]